MQMSAFSIARLCVLCRSYLAEIVRASFQCLKVSQPNEPLNPQQSQINQRILRVCGVLRGAAGCCGVLLGAAGWCGWREGGRRAPERKRNQMKERKR